MPTVNVTKYIKIIEQSKQEHQSRFNKLNLSPFLKEIDRLFTQAAADQKTEIKMLVDRQDPILGFDKECLSIYDEQFRRYFSKLGFNQHCMWGEDRVHIFLSIDCSQLGNGPRDTGSGEDVLGR